ILAIGARVGLEAHGRKARYLAEPGLQVADNLLVAHRLVGRGEGRNHAVREAQVLVFELLHVAQDFVLGVVRVENRVREADAHQRILVVAEVDVGGLSFGFQRLLHLVAFEAQTQRIEVVAVELL
nr:hypothetical protein [Tanacetum cinerariifolium]